jgi:hypothetical protein
MFSLAPLIIANDPTPSFQSSAAWHRGEYPDVLINHAFISSHYDTCSPNRFIPPNPILNPDNLRVLALPSFTLNKRPGGCCRVLKMQLLFAKIH